MSLSLGEPASPRPSLTRLLDEPLLDRCDRTRALFAATDVTFALRDSVMMGMVAEQLAEIARVYNTTLFRAEALKAEARRPSWRATIRARHHAWPLRSDCGDEVRGSL